MPLQFATLCKRCDRNLGVREANINNVPAGCKCEDSSSDGVGSSLRHSLFLIRNGRLRLLLASAGASEPLSPSWPMEAMMATIIMLDVLEAAHLRADV